MSDTNDIQSRIDALKKAESSPPLPAASATPTPPKTDDQKIITENLIDLTATLHIAIREFRQEILEHRKIMQRLLDDMPTACALGCRQELQRMRQSEGVDQDPAESTLGLLKEIRQLCADNAGSMNFCWIGIALGVVVAVVLLVR
jgi:hypothetical protein